MAAKTIDNCSLIKKSVKIGIGYPDCYIRTFGERRCFGYQKSENDDEPCKQCKRCKYYAGCGEE